MKKHILLFLLLISFSAQSQVFDVDTLHYSGDPDRYINFVIVGDGYTVSEQDSFHKTAISLKNALFSQVPFSNYRNYFNVFAIRVISEESGAKHPDNLEDCFTANPQVPYSDPDNYFGSSFDMHGIHRLIVAQRSDKIAEVMAANIPNFDQVIVVANSPYYGGSGGVYSTITAHPSSPEVVLHEAGHSFANLADEYYAGDVYVRERPNMTSVTDPQYVKWKNWVGTAGTGIYQHCCGGLSGQWYKPHRNCKMQLLGAPFCSVCKETIIEKVHELVNPVVNYSPQFSRINGDDTGALSFMLTEVMKPVPNTLKTEWKLNGTRLLLNKDTLELDKGRLANGPNLLEVTVEDTTAMLRVDYHSSMHVSSISWYISKTASNIRLAEAESKITYTLYPNPSSQTLYITADTDGDEDVFIEIATTDGKKISESKLTWLGKGNFEGEISVSGLAGGTYLLRIISGTAVHTKLFIKQ
jgi:hypothetical protein